MSYTSRVNGRFNNAVSHPNSNYRCNAYHPGDRQPLSFPKEVLESEVNCVREFFDQKQLYYFLTWSSKMQLIDEEFKHYRLLNAPARIPEVIIFNAELHDIKTNAELFVVAIPTLAQSKGARFVMSEFMDAQRIAREFGFARTDLPMGSRRKHSFFTADRFPLDSAAQHIAIRDMREISLERPQQYKKEKEVLPSSITHNVDALNTAIASALEQIKNGSLKFIRTLRIDRKRAQIECVPLIPIKVATVKQWMAVSFRDRSQSQSQSQSRYNRSRYNAQSQPQRLEIASLYTNCYDVVSKAALVNPDNVYALHWLTGERPGAVPCSVCAKAQREHKEKECALQRLLSESYQMQEQHRDQLTTLTPLLSGQVRSYNLMLAMMSEQVRSLQCQLEQQKQQQTQAFMAIPVAIQMPTPVPSMPNTPLPSMPMWTGITPVTTPLASPSHSPQYDFTPATSRCSSPAMVPALPRMVDFSSAGSNTSACSNLSSEREMSPLNLNRNAEEYKPANMSVPCLKTLCENKSIHQFEDSEYVYCETE